VVVCFRFCLQLASSPSKQEGRWTRVWFIPFLAVACWLDILGDVNKAKASTVCASFQTIELELERQRQHDLCLHEQNASLSLYGAWLVWSVTHDATFYLFSPAVPAGGLQV